MPAARIVLGAGNSKMRRIAAGTTDRTVGWCTAGRDEGLKAGYEDEGRGMKTTAHLK